MCHFGANGMELHPLRLEIYSYTHTRTQLVSTNYITGWNNATHMPSVKLDDALLVKTSRLTAQGCTWQDYIALGRCTSPYSLGGDDIHGDTGH